MKGKLIAINASYIHTNLAVRLLSKVTHEMIPFEEYTINQPVDAIIDSILKDRPKYLFWSAYIWNWELIKYIASKINKMGLNIKQFVGGPEVSYDILDHMEDNCWIDGIIYGEGEVSFQNLTKALINNQDLKKVKGIAFRQEEEIIINPQEKLLSTLDSLPQLDYAGEDVRNKIIYYESMRGCPFKCAYCLSSNDDIIRLRSLDKIKEDMNILFKTGVKQIKFVDRTFNLYPERTLEILKFFKENAPDHINIHFEMTLELLDERILKSFQEARKGLFQIEAGVQSTDHNVLKHISRSIDLEKLTIAMQSLEKNNNIHRHLDLIVGLPKATMDTFKKSFNDIYYLNAEKIQVGFLKLLRGTVLREQADKYGIVYDDKAPYEVIRTDTLTACEIQLLKKFAHIVDDYINEDIFKETHKLALSLIDLSPFDFFMELTHYLDERNLIYSNQKRLSIFKHYYDFLQCKLSNYMDILYGTLKEDFYMYTDRYIGDILGFDDPELSKKSLRRWLEQIDHKELQELNKSIKNIVKNSRGIKLPHKNIERLIIYKNHKVYKYFDRKE